jgi:hypothetical protein
MTAVLGFVSPNNTARAAELRVLASVALTSALDELSPVFENATGDKLSIGYGLAADLRKHILDGEIGARTGAGADMGETLFHRLARLFWEALDRVDYVVMFLTTPGLSDAERVAILGETAAKLLAIKPA